MMDQPFSFVGGVVTGGYSRLACRLLLEREREREVTVKRNKKLRTSSMSGSDFFLMQNSVPFNAEGCQ